MLALQVGTASAGGDGDDFGRHGFGKGVLGLVDARICRRHRSSEETRAWCDSISGLIGRDLFKAIVGKILRRTNQPPVADLKLDLVQPDRVDLNALDSTDEDGFPHIHHFRLEDEALTSGRITGGLLIAGGGGGGSYAAQSALDNIDSSQWSRSAGDGWIYIPFGPQP